MCPPGYRTFSAGLTLILFGKTARALLPTSKVQLQVDIMPSCAGWKKKKDENKLKMSYTICLFKKGTNKEKPIPLPQQFLQHLTVGIFPSFPGAVFVW